MLPLIAESAILGAASAAGFGLTYTRLPTEAQNFIKNHPLLSDVVLTVSTYHVLGGTLTALMAAGFVSVVISILLFIPKVREYLARLLDHLYELFSREQALIPA